LPFAEGKKWLGRLLTVIIISLFTGASVAWAADNAKAGEAPQIQVYINGENCTESLYAEGIEPYLVDGRTYLPLRAIAEQMGVPVLWIPESNSVYVGDLSQTSNPLLRYLSEEDQTPPLEEIKPEDFIPALEYAMAVERQTIEDIIHNPEVPSFANTIEPLETMNMSKEISSIMFALNYAANTDALQKVTEEAAVLLSNFDNDILFNKALFDRVSRVYQQANTQNLTPEQLTLLNNCYQAFVDNGINLTAEQKARIRQIDSRMEILFSRFSANLLEDAGAAYLLITDQQDLQGLPDSLVAAASQAAKSRGLAGWYFTMDYPTVSAFLSLAESQEKRREMDHIYRSIGMRTPETDNREILKEIVNLRLEKANLLGYPSYADYALQSRMVKNRETVMEFLNELAAAALPAAREDVKEIEEYAQSKGLKNPLASFDVAYYDNQLRQEKYNFDEEALRPYFELNQVKAGVFELAKRLYGLRLVKNDRIQVYHPEVEVYEVYDENNELLGIIYMDFFCRNGKGAGAWATSFRSQEKNDGEDVLPLINLVYNFPVPGEDGSSLLSFYDLTTFLHEFGHGMHFLLSNANYASLSSLRVAMDFMELPSTLMENWAYEKEFLHLFARDYKTGEPLPEETIDRLNEMRNLLNAPGFVGQIQYALLDMGWHTMTEPENITVEDFENQIMKDIRLFPPQPGRLISPGFGHLFEDNSYAAGYYSYIWSSAMQADVYEVFKQQGIMERSTGEAFREKVLSKGASVDPMKLFTDFVGRELSTEALLKQEGLWKDVN